MSGNDVFIVNHNSAKEFLITNESLLLKNETLNSLFLGLSRAIIQDELLDVDEPFFATVYSDGCIVGQMIKTHRSRGLIISQMTLEVIKKVVPRLAQIKLNVTSVQGPMPAVQSFVQLWAQYQQLSYRLSIYQGLYEIKKVEFIPNVEGQMIQADMSFFSTLEVFAQGFIKEVFPEDKKVQEGAGALILKHLKLKKVFVWVDLQGNAVSMATTNRETRNAVTISLVYTPVEWRKKGYASALMSRLTQYCLDNGKTMCNLYTDLSNPDSNKVYKKIGYYKVGEEQLFEFFDDLDRLV